MSALGLMLQPTDKDKEKRTAGVLKQQVLKTKSMEVNPRKAAGSLEGLGWAGKHSLPYGGLPCARPHTIRAGISLCPPEHVLWDETPTFLSKIAQVPIQK